MSVPLYAGADAAAFAAAVAERLSGLAYEVDRVAAPGDARLWLMSTGEARAALEGHPDDPQLVVAVAAQSDAEHDSLSALAGKVHLVHPDVREPGGWRTSPEKAADAWHALHRKVKLPWECLGPAPAPAPGLVEEFTAQGARLAAGGLVNRPADGCMSVRGAGGFWITASGTPKAGVGAEDLVWVERAGGDGLRGRSDGRRPSSGTPWHGAIYAQRDDVGAIVHGHCRRLTYGDSLADRRTARYAPYGTMDVYESMKDLVATGDFLILTGHGEVSLGPTLTACVDRYLAHVEGSDRNPPG
jgi:hypothetical protein